MIDTTTTTITFEQLNKWTRLYAGDCIQIMKTMPSNSVDLIIADPPYKLEMPTRNGVSDLLASKNINLVNEDWDKFTLDEYINFTERWMSESFRLLKSSGSLFVFGTYHNIGLVNYVIQRNKWMIINEIAWYKRNAIPNLACRRLTASFESILWVANNKKYIFNYDDMKNGDFSDDLLKKQGFQMRNVWDIPTNSSENVGHPTQKPTKLYERLFKMACPKDKVVILDPFAGSGTTGVVAKKLDMNAMLIENESTYQTIIRNRLSAPSIF